MDFVTDDWDFDYDYSPQAELLGQGERWIDGSREELLIRNMDDGHLTNLRGWLVRNAERLLKTTTVRVKWPFTIQTTKLYQAVDQEIERRRYRNDLRRPGHDQSWFRVEATFPFEIMAADDLAAYQQVRDMVKCELEGTEAEEWTLEITVKPANIARGE